jgi:hypothetical protein
VAQYLGVGDFGGSESGVYEFYVMLGRLNAMCGLLLEGVEAAVGCGLGGELDLDMATEALGVFEQFVDGDGGETA